MNIIVIGPSIFEGMAGTKRLQNLFYPMYNLGLITLSNLIIHKNSEIITPGIFKDINYLNLSQYRYKLKYSIKGKQFIQKNYKKDKKNILYMYGYPSILSLQFIKYARRKGYKVIIDIVEDISFAKSKRQLNKIKRIHSLRLLKRIDHFSDCIFVISSYLYQKFQNIIRINFPLYLIPISINLENIKISDSNSIKSKEHVFKIFYGGSFGEKDGLFNMLRSLVNVLNKYKNIRLILTGKGNKKRIDEVISFIEKKNLEGFVEYKGFLPQEEYFKLLITCDIFCMTRIDSQFANAGFPFKLGEFLATSKAVIATKVGDVTSYLNNENALLIEPDNIDQLTKSILYLIENPKKISEIGRKGRLVAENCFNADIISKHVYQILSNL